MTTVNPQSVVEDDMPSIVLRIQNDPALSCNLTWLEKQIWKTWREQREAKRNARL